MRELWTARPVPPPAATTTTTTTTHHPTMARDSDLSKTADKGKGKAVDNERKADETQRNKAGQPVANGKKDDDKAECLCPSPAPPRHVPAPAALTAV